MKKDKLWAKFKMQEELHRWWGVEGGIDEDGIKLVLNIIEQVEEPEVLSQEWIDEHKVARVNDLRKMTMSEVVPVDELQGLLVPKPELPVIPKYVAEWVEEYRKVYEDKFFIIGYDIYDNAIHRDVGDWIVDNQEKFVKAWFDGYEVEEQKYYVDLDASAYVAKWHGDGQVGIYTDDIFGSDEFEFYLTEEEIKDFDERFWPFAEPAEQRY